MYLVDATYINQSGPLMLLDLLIKYSTSSNVLFLLDIRIKGDDLIKKYKNKNFIFISPREFSRFKFYLKNKNKIKRVLCFANVPPPIKLKCQVYTYFHNVNLIDKNSQNHFPFKTRVLTNIKYFIIKHRKNNTNKWLTQTENVRNMLKSSLKISIENVDVLPFFDDIQFDNIESRNDSFFYPAVGLPHKNHILLLEVWEKLYKEGNFNHQLHLTIDFNSDLGKKIIALQDAKIPITNHGYLNRNEIMRLYRSCRYVIHPSFGESFGLVLLEAIQNNCILLAPNLPYVNAIVIPNYFFECNCAESLIETIKLAIIGKEDKTCKILVQNSISTLIDLIQE